MVRALYSRYRTRRTTTVKHSEKVVGDMASAETEGLSGTLLNSNTGWGLTNIPEKGYDKRRTGRERIGNPTRSYNKRVTLKGNR